MAQESLRHAWLRALGPREMPVDIVLADGAYRHRRTFKHDFFAATGLYEGPSGRVVLKLGRTVSLFGLPTIWLGEWLAHREASLYEASQGIHGVPRFHGRVGRTGIVHAFVAGHPLQGEERVDADFFPRLERLLEGLHARGIAYVDLEKRENILVGDDGRPWLIDFQISWQSGGPAAGRFEGRASCPPLSGQLRSAGAGGPPADRRTAPRGPDAWQRLLPESLRRFVLARLQAADHYHLVKHRRRHRPESLTPQEIADSYTVSWPIRLHRRVFRPLTLLRRRALKLLTGRSRSPKQEGPEFIEPIK